MIKIFRTTFLILISLLITTLPQQVSAANVDVYLVYAGTEKAIAKTIKKKLSGDFKVKTYNVDLLALADYSGKQKVASKLAKARVVVLIRDKPGEILSDTSFKTVVEIMDENDLDRILQKLQ